MSDSRRADGDAWLDALIARHTAALPPPQFFKAIRALSARYVESRGRLADRSPIDSAGKRSAFAAFYAPLHFLTTREIVRALAAGVPALRTIETIVDLGCGTGVASAAWALECGSPSEIRGIDRHEWALSEAAWNWRQLHVRASSRRGDFVDAAEHLAEHSRAAQSLNRTAVLLGWSANELEEVQRARLLPTLLRLVDRGASVLAIEPIARSATPWWPKWVEAVEKVAPHTRSDDWKFDVDLPPALAQISEAAGFRERTLAARTLLIMS